MEQFECIAKSVDCCPEGYTKFGKHCLKNMVCATTPPIDCKSPVPKNCLKEVTCLEMTSLSYAEATNPDSKCHNILSTCGSSICPAGYRNNMKGYCVKYPSSDACLRACQCKYRNGTIVDIRLDDWCDMGDCRECQCRWDSMKGGKIWGTCRAGVCTTSGPTTTVPITTTTKVITTTTTPVTTTTVLTTTTVAPTPPPVCNKVVSDVASGNFLRFYASSTEEGRTVDNAAPTSIGWRSSSNDSTPSFSVRFKDIIQLSHIDINPYNIRSVSVDVSPDNKEFTTLKDSKGAVRLWSMDDKFGEYQRIRLAMLKDDLINVLSVRVNIQRIRSDLAAGLNIRVYGCPMPLECKAPMILTSCLCEKTCQKTVCNKTAECMQGCTCPEGMVQNGGKCIPRTECPCYYNIQSRVLKIGEKIPSEKHCTDVLCSVSGLVREVNNEREGCNCTGGMELTPCKDYHKTCKHRKLPEATMALCKPGCACPKDKYMDESTGKCVATCPCEHGGKKYPVGEKWTDKCRQCECTMDKGAVCKESGCHLKSCPADHVLKNDNAADGKCCECVPFKYCEYKGVKHALDTVWSDGPCKSLECQRTSSGDTKLVEKITACPATCANGSPPVSKGNMCCYCEPVTTTASTLPTTTTIIYDTTTTVPICSLHLCRLPCGSETMRNASEIGSHCIKSGYVHCGYVCPGGYTLKRMSKTSIVCEMTETCTTTEPPTTTTVPPTTTTLPPTTTSIATTTTARNVTTTEAPSTCKPVTSVAQKLRIGDCVSTEAISLTACGGGCSSGARVSETTGMVVSQCACCQPTATTFMEAKLSCPTGANKIFKYQVIQSCGCRNCK